MVKNRKGKSKINGTGIFSERKVKKGEFIGFVSGAVRHIKTGSVTKALTHPNWIGFKKDYWYDTEKPFVFINHSCNPNTGIKGTKSIYALRDIKQGEELTFDYAISEVDLDWFLNCHCKEKNCRKTIKSVQSLSKSIFEKYLPYIPTYMKQEYKKVHGMRQ